MKVQYIFTKEEIKAAKDKMRELRQVALMSRDAGELEDSKEFYLRAKGFEESLTILGILQPKQ